MKRLSILIALSFLTGMQIRAQLFSTSSAFVGFYSKTPLEDVKAESRSALAIMHVVNKEIAFSVTNTTFDFPNKLMQEHFNEKYIESEKYPTSTFKGKVQENVDLTAEGEYKVTVKGKLNIHGVEVERTIPGTITVRKGSVELKSNFKVKAADHKVTIPKLIMEKLAEEMDVTVDAVLNPRK